MSKAKKTKEQFMTPKKSPLQNELVLAPASGPRYGGSSVGHKGPKTTIHTDGPERCDWALGRGEKITSVSGAKVASASDVKMGRPRAGGSGRPFTENPEQHDSKRVGKFLTKAETMGSNRTQHRASDVKLRVPNFRKGKQD